MKKNPVYTIQNFTAPVSPKDVYVNTFKNHLETLTEEVLDSNENLVKWLFDIHNEVNKSTGKPIFSFDDFISMYTTNSASILNVTNIEKKEDKIENNNDNMKKLIKEEFKEELMKEIMAELETKNNKNIKKEDNMINKFKNNSYIWIILIILILVIIIYLYKRF